MQFLQFPRDNDLIHAAKKPEKEAIDPLALKGGLNKDWQADR
jgi:hypothetical protein